MEFKKCGSCKKTLPVTMYGNHKKKSDGLQCSCRDCVRAQQRRRYHEKLKYDPTYKEKQKRVASEWYEKNKDRICEHRRSVDKNIRIEALNAYGGICDCCGENKYEFLAIDHIDGGGRKHRKEVGNKIHRWLKNNDYPEGFRVLCHNCNASIGYYGYCPHYEERGIITL